MYDKSSFRCDFIWRWKRNISEVTPLKVGQLRTYTCVILNPMEERSGQWQEYKINCWQELSLLYIRKKKCLLSFLSVCWKYKGKYSKIFRSRPTWRYAMQYGWDRYLYQSGTLYRSGNNYFDGDIVTRSGNFYFSFEGDSYRFRKPNLFFFISTKDFSFPQFAFTLLKMFAKF